uniref:Peptidase S1 domain-containing protein n=1 Tax=Glossina brevipalpis TaxID=37001 RepID=A0A1A9WH04_9MUSC
MFAKYIVWVRCKVGKRERLHIGVIISKNAVLTANSMNMNEISCTIFYRNINFLNFDKVEDRIAGLTTANYENFKEVRAHWSLPQLKLVLTEKEIQLNKKSVAIIPLPKQKYSESDTCVVVTHDDKLKLVQRKTMVLRRAECELAYPNLHENIICIQVPTKDICNTSPCSVYNEEGAPLICDGILTAIVTKDNSQCEEKKPCLTAKVYESRHWIETNIELLNRNNTFRGSVVSVKYVTKQNKGVLNSGAIISNNQVLTSSALNEPFKGFVYYNDGERVTWRKAKSFSEDWRPKANKIQISIVQLTDHNYFKAKKFEILPVKSSRPTNDSICVLGIKLPKWHKLEIIFLDDNICCNQLSKYHKNYTCIRPKFEGIQFGTRLLGGTPIICDGELTAITANVEDDAKNQPHPCIFLYKYKMWLKKSMRSLESLQYLRPDYYQIIKKREDYEEEEEEEKEEEKDV